MKKLKLIRDGLFLAKVLLFAGLLFVAYNLTTLPDGVFHPISDPCLHITSKELRNTMYDALFQSRPPVIGDPVITSISRIEMSMRVDSSLKIAFVVLALLAFGYIFWVLEVFRRIVKSVEEMSSFSRANITRVKLAGLLIMLAPVYEWLVRKGFVLWIESRLTFEGMSLKTNSDYGISIFIVGLLIIVLGVAFEQAQKLQEEHELTI